MTIRVVIQNNIAQQAFDLSELVTEIALETAISGAVGSCKLSYLDETGALLFPEGAILSVAVNEQRMFYGYVFEISETSKGGIVSLVAFDQTIYFKNKDTYVFSGMTADQVFAKVCDDFQLKYSIVHPSSYVVPDKIHDDKPLSEVVDFGITQTLINTGKWYFIRDIYGVLNFLDLGTQATNLVLGDNSLLTDYNYSRSINDDTYNQIKITKENQETQKREVYLARDTNTINAWGTLQYYEKVDENANAAQIEARLDMLLKVKNRVTQKLKLPCLGDLRVYAGCGVALNISKLVRYGIQPYSFFIVTSCTHTFRKDEHTMNLEVQLDV